MLSARELEERRSGYGGSDVAAIVGEDPWGSPRDVWLDKLGLKTWTRSTPRQRWGHVLEWTIAVEWAKARAEKTGLPIKVKRPRKKDLPFRHPDRSWQLGTPDVFVLGDEVDRVGADCKVVGERMAHLWHDEETDQAPHYYVCQGSWYMDLLDYERWYLVPMIWGEEPRTYTIERNPEFEGLLREEVERFHTDYVLTKEPPPDDGSDASRKALQRIYPNAVKDDLITPAEAAIESFGDIELETVEKLLRNLARADADYKAAEAVVKMNRAMVQELIGSHYGMRSSIGKALWIPMPGKFSFDADVAQLEICNHIVLTLSDVLPKDKLRTLLDEVSATFELHEKQGEGFRQFRWYPSE